MKILHVSEEIVVACEDEAKDPASWVEHRVLCEDRERYLGIISEKAKHQFVISRQVLYEVLNQIGAEDAKLAPSRPNKRPEILNSKDIWVSIAHTPGLIVAAASRIGPIGVDVELQNRDLEGYGIVQRCYSMTEQRTVELLHGEARRHELLDMWLAKEAMSKVMGTGLATDFREFIRDKYCLNSLGIRELVYSTQDMYRLCWTVPERR